MDRGACQATIHGVAKSQTGLGIHTHFPGGSAGKEFACNAGDLGSIPGLGRSPGQTTRERLSSPVFWPGEFHGLSLGLQRVGHDWAIFTSLEGVEKGGEDGIQIKSTGVPFSNSQMELALISIQEKTKPK